MLSCRICGGSEVRRRFAVGPYSVVKCHACGFGWPEPLPTAEELAALYSGCLHPEAIEDRLNAPERCRVAARLRALAPAARTLLDVGCGFGHFLDHARTLGFETWGVDPDAGRVEQAAARGHVVECCEAIPGIFGGRRFEIVVLNHVIEHVRDPVALLRRLRDLLAPGGLLFVGCPNFAGLHAKLVGAHYHHFCPPEHIAYFTPCSLRHAALTAGFMEIAFEFYTHPLHVKQLLAYFARLRFLRGPEYRPPQTSPPPVRRFVDGRFRALRVPIYSAVLAASSCLSPLVNVLGGDHIESYWRRT